MLPRETWFLVNADKGIVDEAATKGILMSRHRFKTSFRDGLTYTVLSNHETQYLVREKDMKRAGFGWALTDYRLKGN